MTYPFGYQITAIIFIVAELVAIALALHAMRTARTAQGSVGWVVFLLAAPFVAVPAYAVFGWWRFSGYVEELRKARRTGDAPQRDRAGAADGRDPPGAAPGAALAFERLAMMHVARGNDCKLLVDGRQTFDAILDAIGKAERYVNVSYFAIHDDELGRAFGEALKERVRAGVTVRVLFDAIGNLELPERYVKDLREGGVDIRRFRATRHPLKRLQINFRNHRKIVVVDGSLGFTGGLNVGDMYMGRSEKLSPWRDTHLAIRGPAAQQLDTVFAEDWLWASGELLERGATPAPAGSVDALIVPPGPADTRETGSLYFCNAIAAAKERVWIASPYFVPDVDVLSALKVAALRGVQVRLLLPANRDKLLVWLAAFAYFDEVREAGVEIRLYRPGFMHQKVIVVDESFCSVGSVNLDNRSCRLNFEATAVLFDAGAARRAAEMLEADFESSVLHDANLSELEPFRRWGAPVARLFAPVL